MPISGAAAGIAQPSINSYLASALPEGKLGGAGTALGPLVFGVVASSRSFTAVWVGAGCIGVAAALVMVVGSYLLRGRL
jgi:hypothetical protein